MNPKFILKQKLKNNGVLMQKMKFLAKLIIILKNYNKTQKNQNN